MNNEVKVTQEILDLNPTLTDEGVKVGDVVETSRIATMPEERKEGEDNNNDGATPAATGSES